MSATKHEGMSTWAVSAEATTGEGVARVQCTVWLTEDRTGCYWDPNLTTIFDSPMTAMEAARSALIRRDGNFEVKPGSARLTPVEDFNG